MAIFLCDSMRDEFAERYPVGKGSMVVGNALTVEPRQACRDRPLTDTLVVGHLSNMTNSKGIEALLDVHLACTTTAGAFNLVLAGTADHSVKQAIVRHSRKLGADVPSFRWVGPVHGASKNQFFESLDVFLYLSPLDADPVVLHEARAHGVHVIARRTGCIVSNGHDDVVESVCQAAEAIRKLVTEPWLLLRRREAAQELHRIAYAEAVAAMGCAVDSLLASSRLSGL